MTFPKAILLFDCFTVIFTVTSLSKQCYLLPFMSKCNQYCVELSLAFWPSLPQYYLFLILPHATPWKKWLLTPALDNWAMSHKRDGQKDGWTRLLFHSTFLYFPYFFLVSFPYHPWSIFLDFVLLSRILVATPAFVPFTFSPWRLVLSPLVPWGISLTISFYPLWQD